MEYENLDVDLNRNRPIAFVIMAWIVRVRSRDIATVFITRTDKAIDVALDVQDLIEQLLKHYTHQV